LAEKAYEERSVQMAVGDRLYLYSDGVLEAMAPSGDLLGDARLQEVVVRGRFVPLRESIDSLVEEIERWRGSASAQDDISIVAVEFSAGSGRCQPQD
jgi:phosphoserine phosphatase RsbU/P